MVKTNGSRKKIAKDFSKKSSVVCVCVCDFFSKFLVSKMGTAK